jgi:hypothetical protein
MNGHRNPPPVSASRMMRLLVEIAGVLGVDPTDPETDVLWDDLPDLVADEVQLRVWAERKAAEGWGRGVGL